MLCLSLDLVTLHFICAPGPDDAFCFRYYPVSATTAKRIYDETINSDYDYKGRAFHLTALVLALAKIQDIFKKYSG